MPVRRGREVVDFTQDDGGVDVELSDGTMLRAAYLVGCDGGRSLVRKTAGIDFPGLDPSASWIIAEVEMRDAPVIGTRREGGGIGSPRRVLVAAYGTDFGAHTPNRISRFTDMSRQAESYRAGRVLLCGDAAHVHPPQGGQGLNLGVQDAVNLGWKLAQVIEGTSPDRLLDTYHDERHPIGARVLHNTSAQVALSTPDDRHRALHETMADLLALDEPRQRTAAMLTGLDVRYDLGEGHPLLGRRMPDLDLDTAVNATRVYELLHDAWPVLLNFGEPGSFDIGVWADRVQSVDATYDGVWEIPVIGVVDPPTAVLIRPDG